MRHQDNIPRTFIECCYWAFGVVLHLAIAAGLFAFFYWGAFVSDNCYANIVGWVSLIVGLNWLAELTHPTE